MHGFGIKLIHNARNNLSLVFPPPLHWGGADARGTSTDEATAFGRAGSAAGGQAAAEVGGATSRHRCLRCELCRNSSTNSQALSNVKHNPTSSLASLASQLPKPTRPRLLINRS